MSDGNDTASVASGSRAVGRYGENLACRQLEARGMRVLARNWRCRVGEIDIVAVEGDVLVVCEVKTRRQVKFGAPAEAVTAAKVRRLRVLAAEWLATQAPEGGFDAVRVDVISVLIPTRGAAQVEHLIGVE